MTVLTFLPRFAPLVKAGTKLRTIRGQRKRPIKVGDKLSLRQWSARPDNSPQIVLREAVCVRLSEVRITGDSAMVNGHAIIDVDTFARLDGFNDWPDMVAHFTTARGLPFAGVLIEWNA
jgi:hypothetical protein